MATNEQIQTEANRLGAIASALDAAKVALVQARYQAAGLVYMADRLDLSGDAEVKAAVAAALAAERAWLRACNRKAGR
jgi:hypothetical protein